MRALLYAASLFIVAGCSHHSLDDTAFRDNDAGTVLIPDPIVLPVSATENTVEPSSSAKPTPTHCNPLGCAIERPFDVWDGHPELRGR